MEMSKFADELYSQLEEQLENVNNNIDSGISKLSESMHTVTTQLNQLRKCIKENGFINEHVCYGDVDHPVPGQIDHWVS